MPYIGKAPSSGIRSRFIYTATSGQTTFTGSDSNGKTLGYTDSEYVDVYLNGVLLEPSDYTATSKTSVVLDSGATVGDTMEIVVYDTFSVFNGTFSGDITVGGKVTGDLTIEDDLKLTSDNAQIAFGADSDVTLTHNPDSGLLLKNTNTADGNPAKLVLQTGETAVEADDVLGRIDFQAPDEATGTDAVAVGANIRAVAESDFTASANATTLEFRTASSGTLSNRLVIKSDGKIGIGRDSPTGSVHVQTASGTDAALYLQTSATTDDSVIHFGDNGNASAGKILYDHDENALTFDRGGEAMRINTSRTIFIGRTSGTPSSSEFGMKLAQSGLLQNSRDTDGAGATFQAFGSLGQFRAMGDGDAQNTNNSYGSLSDEKLKENISDASSQWDDIKAVRIRKYSLKERKLDAADSLGVIAQELEASGMNGLVKEVEVDIDSEETVKAVKYSILYMKAVKALQEAMARIETLETKVAALEAE